ncbi:interferon-induced protein 44-like [Haliotis rubra]|uniref:interferon-induced protein 44-like n=1 Tax=Haliotis rubra TaxID=36100 RepID=UPI001EE5A173|nr:interferon-induced protein 44-like [Haliotis rubra]
MAKIQSRYKSILSKWLGGRKEYTLLYQATRDGCSAEAFHRMCNDKGPTVTLLYNTAGNVFGGYIAVPWQNTPITCSGGHNPNPAGQTAWHCPYCRTVCNINNVGTTSQYSNDATAFIFRLTAKKSFKPKLYRVKKPGNAVMQNSHYGPCFGSDLQPFTKSVTKTDNYFKGNGTINVGTHYDMNGDDNNVFSGGNLQYTDIEVYHITEPTGMPSASIDGAWRKFGQVNREMLLSYIERFTPPEDSKAKAVNVLLLGAVGAGKSSFFNSINSVFQGEITGLARSGSADRSLTTTYRRYRVRSNVTGGTLKMRFCDTRGMECEGGLDLVDLIAVIEGHVPDRFRFNPTAPIDSDCTGYNSSPSPDDKIHCIAFVIDGTTVDVFPEKILHSIKSLQQRINTKGIPQVVILTKADKVCIEVQEDVNKMFHSAAIGDLVEQAGQLFGLPRSCVFPVKNYEDEVQVDRSVDMPLLLCLKQILRFADDYLQDSMSSD